MALTKIPKIDQLFESAAAAPLNRGNAVGQEAAVGIIQELLTSQGYSGMPDVRQLGVYGKFGSKTEKNLKDFRIKHNLQKPADPVQVDFWTIRRLAQEPSVSPRASRGYLALALDIELTGLMRVISFVTLAEGAGKFAAFNANTDKQGLSYGVIQWAQKPGRLHDIVRAFQTGQPALFKSVFGSDADEMVLHTAKTHGGVIHKPKDPTDGRTTDPKFDLIDGQWKERFLNAALAKPFQKIQIETASQWFVNFVAHIPNYAAKIRSERGYAFMIDLGNQHGEGRENDPLMRGARGIYKAVVTNDMSEDAAMEKMSNESVRRLALQYGENSNEARGTRTRRDFFRSATLLSTDPFNPN